MSDPSELPPEAIRAIEAALAEDVGDGDRTTLWTVPAGARGEARIVAKAAGTIAGTAVAAEVFRRVDPGVTVTVQIPDGSAVTPGTVVMSAAGATRSLLTAERTALNFLQRLCGIATLTRCYVNAVRGTRARILDTRKTTPGLRALEKAAVLAGGGTGHRRGLSDMVLIKENHIAAAGGIAAAVDAVRARNHEGLAVEVETTSLAEVDEALAAGVHRILFDNMPIPLLRNAVQRVRDWTGAHPETEASGGISLATVRGVAESGVDYISVGALTHSAPALDLSLLLTPA